MDDEAQQAMEERMQEALDCLRVVHMHGLEGTAQILAAHLGLSRDWRQLKEHMERKVA